MNREAQYGDRVLFRYPKEPQFDVELSVTRVDGFGPEDLVFFSDGSHCKQKHLKHEDIELLGEVGE